MGWGGGAAWGGGGGEENHQQCADTKLIQISGIGDRLNCNVLLCRQGPTLNALTRPGARGEQEARVEGGG